MRRKPKETKPAKDDAGSPWPTNVSADSLELRLVFWARCIC